MGSKSPGNTSQPPAFFSKLTESNSAMVKSKKQEINKKLNTHNRNEQEYSKADQARPSGARQASPALSTLPAHIQGPWEVLSAGPSTGAELHRHGGWSSAGHQGLVPLHGGQMAVPVVLCPLEVAVGLPY